MEAASDASSIVFIVDDDVPMRESLSDLCQSVGHQVQAFGSAAEFLSGNIPDITSCLVLDVRMPGLSGLDFQTELKRANIRIPIIFITGHGDIPMSVRAMKAGAVEFLTKPIREQDLLDAIRVALDVDRERRQQDVLASGLRSRFDALTSREREVIVLVAAGLMNKQCAAKIGISEVSVKVHRHNAMKKLEARSLADLIRMANMIVMH